MPNTDPWGQSGLRLPGLGLAVILAASACTARTSPFAGHGIPYPGDTTESTRTGDSAALGGDHWTTPDCAPESDAAFCGRLLADCGLLSDLDNCQATRTADCGGCSDPADRCGGSGTGNACGHGQCSDEALTTVPTAGGSGTPTDPFLLCTAEQLGTLGDHTGFMAGIFQLSQDIELSTLTAPFTPIGTPVNPFTGTLDGAKHTISNLTLAASEGDNIGLFGQLAGTVHDLSIIGVSIDAPNSLNVGGLAGYASEAIVRHVTVDAQGDSVTPDIVGDAKVGGLLGRIEATSIYDSSSTAFIRASGDDVGGLVGYSRNSSTRRSWSAGRVESPMGYHVGGLVGNCWSADGVDSSFSHSTVIGGERVGGLVGYQNGFCDVTSSFATGDVTGNNRVGGLIGQFNVVAWMKRSYATGRVVALGNLASDQNAGGLAGLAADTSQILASFWNSEVNFDLQGIPLIADGSTVIGLDSATMRTATPFLTAGWDLANEWSIVPNRNSGLPALHTDRSLCNTPVFDPLAWGLGTDLVPHYLCSVEQVLQLALPANIPFNDRAYALVADIDLTGRPTVPIGTAANMFTGNFSGGGHTVTGLEIHADTLDDVGFFGYAANNIIRDLHLVDPVVRTTGPVNHVGIVAGSVVGATVGNCSVTSAHLAPVALTVESSAAAPATDIGAGIGRASGSDIFGITTSVAMRVGSHPQNVGGVLGTASTATTLARCVSDTSIQVDAGADANTVFAGGLAGQLAAAAALSDSYFERVLNVDGVTGGLVGAVIDASVRTSHTSGAVQASPLARVAIGSLTGSSTVAGVVWLAERSPGVDDSTPGAVRITPEQATDITVYQNLGWWFYPAGYWLMLAGASHPTLYVP